MQILTSYTIIFFKVSKMFDVRGTMQGYTCYLTAFNKAVQPMEHDDIYYMLPCR